MRASLRFLAVSIVMGAALAQGALPAASAPPASAQDEHRRIAEYWTPARRASAIPRDVSPRGDAPKATARPGGGGGGATGTVTGATWTKPEADVVKTTGKVFFRENGGLYTCSGSVIDSSHGNLVLTAGHCVHGGGSGEHFVTNWIFYPAWNGAPSALGEWTATDLATTNKWADDRNFDDDAGFAVVVGSSTTSLEAALTAAGVTIIPRFVRGDANLSSSAFGYPASKKYKGNTLTYCAGTAVLDRDPYDTMALACNMTGGSSGGPWFRGASTSGEIHSLNSYGYSSLAGFMFGPVFGDGEAAVFTDFEAATADCGEPTAYRCVDFDLAA